MRIGFLTPVSVSSGVLADFRSARHVFGHVLHMTSPLDPAAPTTERKEPFLKSQHPSPSRLSMGHIPSQSTRAFQRRLSDASPLDALLGAPAMALRWHSARCAMRDSRLSSERRPWTHHCFIQASSMASRIRATSAALGMHEFSREFLEAVAARRIARYAPFCVEWPRGVVSVD
jgi:hypothetical protein